MGALEHVSPGPQLSFPLSSHSPLVQMEYVSIPPCVTPSTIERTPQLISFVSLMVYGFASFLAFAKLSLKSSSGIILQLCERVKSPNLYFLLQKSCGSHLSLLYDHEHSSSATGRSVLSSNFCVVSK